SRTMYSAARSFTDPPGFAYSHLPQISQPVASLGPLSSTSGVLPMRSRLFSAIVMTHDLGRHPERRKTASLAPTITALCRPTALQRRPTTSNERCKACYCTSISLLEHPQVVTKQDS